MGRFITELEKAIQEIHEKQDRAFRKIALTTLQKVQKKTPVDSGELRRSWTVALNGEPSAYNGNYEALTSARISDRIVIATDKPYAPMLEYGLYPTPSPTGKTQKGFSVQAPQGMIRITVQEMKAFIARNPSLGVG